MGTCNVKTLYSSKVWVGVCRQLLQTLTLFQTKKINGIFISDLQIGFFSLLCFRPTLYKIAATQELLQFAKGFKFPILNKMNFSRDDSSVYNKKSNIF